MGWVNLIGEMVESIRGNGIKVNWRAMVYLLMKMVLISKIFSLGVTRVGEWK